MDHQRAAHPFLFGELSRCSLLRPQTGPGVVDESPETGFPTLRKFADSRPLR